MIKSIKEIVASADRVNIAFGTNKYVAALAVPNHLFIRVMVRCLPVRVRHTVRDLIVSGVDGAIDGDLAVAAGFARPAPEQYAAMRAYYVRMYA